MSHKEAENRSQMSVSAVQVALSKLVLCVASQTFLRPFRLSACGGVHLGRGGNYPLLDNVVSELLSEL